MMSWFQKNTGLVVATIVVVSALLVFNKIWDADYVNWDDPDYIYENEVVLESEGVFSSNTIRSVFSQQVRSIYSPITILSYVVDKSLYGFDAPQKFHITNLLLHLLVILVIFKLSILWGLNKVAATATTLLFALHPMRVEPVMWLTARKDLLFALFFFSALWCYISYYSRDKRRPILYFMVWILFFLSLLTKVLAVAFPVVLLIYHWSSGKYVLGDWVKKTALFFIVSLAYGMLSLVLANNFSSLEVSAESVPFLDRVGLAFSAFSAYVIKSIYPYEMMPVYPYVKAHWGNYFLGITGVSIYLYMIYYAWKSEWKWIVSGMLFFLVNIALTLQIIPVGQGYLSDRYTYLPYFGLFIVYGKLLGILWDKRKPVAMALTTVMLLIYGYITYSHSEIWKDSDKLWQHQLRYTPDLSVALKNIASFHAEKGSTEIAKSYYNRAIAAGSNDPAVYYYQGLLYFKNPGLGSHEEILSLYDTALSLDESYAGIHGNRGVLLATMKRYNEAIESLRMAESLNRDDPSIYTNQAYVYNELGQMDQVLTSLEKYVRYRPEDLTTRFQKAKVEYSLGKTEQSIRTLRAILQLKPDYSEVLSYYNNISQ